MAGRPIISFVIAACNAADTVARTLDSLLAQTLDDWEAVVIDDGSSDATADVVGGFMRRDGRVHLVRQANAGLAAARNAGVNVASGRLLSMLDADDWLDPRYVEEMAATLDGCGDDTLAYCSYRRVAPDGTLFPVYWQESLDAPVKVLPMGCAFPPVCIVVPRRLYLDIGGLDPSLRTCEDWDFWIRVVRCGARFVPVRKSLVYYAMRDGSLSAAPDMLPFLKDGLSVLERAAFPDPRVRTPVRVHAAGIDFPRRLASTGFALWCAGNHAARGREADSLMAALPTIPDMRGHENLVVGAVVEGLRIGLRDFRFSRIREASETWRAPLDRVFTLLEQASAPGLKRRLWLTTMRTMARKDDPPAVPWKVGTVFAVRVDLAAIQPIEPPAACDTGLLVFVDGEEALAVGEIAVAAPVLTPAMITEAALNSVKVRRMLLLGLTHIASHDVRRLMLLMGRRAIPHGRHPGPDRLPNPRLPPNPWRP